MLTTCTFTSHLLCANQDFCTLIERLFAHYFSAERSSYHIEDISWFLQLANEQDKWKACTLELCEDDGIGDTASYMSYQCNENLNETADSVSVLNTF